MTETDGEWKAFLSAPADMGARFEAALRADHDAVFRDAHAAGRREPDAAYRLDALLNLMERGATTRPDHSTECAGEGDGKGEHTGDVAAGRSGGPVQRRGRQQTVIVNVDLAALTRGRVAAGETCRIEGVGEVSLAAVKALIPAAHVSYVIRDGVDVRSVIHLGRQATAHQRTALHARGYECEVPHCRASHLLEIDHVLDWAFSRHTQLDQLAWFCAAHHDEKTTGTRRLAGPPGQRRWETATGIQISQDHPPDRPIQPDPPVDSDRPGKPDRPIEPDRPVESARPATPTGPPGQTASRPGQPPARPAPPRPHQPAPARQTHAHASGAQAVPTRSPPQQMTAL